MKEYLQNSSDVLNALSSSELGLEQAEAEKRLERAETEIDSLEQEKIELEEEMNTSAATDYVRLSEISERITEIDNRIEELFFDMEEAEEFLRENKS